MVDFYFKGDYTMNITEVRITKLNGESKTKAFANITFDGSFVVSGVSVIEGKNGLFVSMPQTIGKDKKYYDTCYPLNKEFRQTISDRVLEEYNK